ncbi:MAG: TlpA family protein disulfide reductase [Bernardetiaceae bacterium]
MIISILLLFPSSISANEATAIKGLVKEGKEKTILFIYNENISESVFQQTKKATLDAKGQFTIPLSLAHAYPALLRYENIDYPIFVRPGSALEVEINALEGTLHIQRGKGADDAIAYQHIRKYFPRLDYPLQWAIEQEENLSPQELTQRTEDRQRRQFLHLNTLYEKLQLSQEYARYEKNNIFYGTALAQYAYLRRQKNEDVAVFLDTFDSLLTQYPIISPFDYNLHCHNYTRYLLQFLEHNYRRYTIETPPEEIKNETEARWEIVQQTFPENIRCYGLMSVLAGKYFDDAQTYDYLNKTDFEAYAKKFSATCTDPFYQRLLDYERKARYNTNALKGITDSPTGLMQFRSIEAKRGGSWPTFNHFLGQHKGKVIMVTFWESACQPFLMEVPKAQQVMDKYGSVVFLFVGLDREKFKWQKALRQYPLVGSYQYWLSEGTSADLPRRYGVIRLPRYLLFDKEGKLAEAEAPSFAETERLDEKIRALIGNQQQNR